MSRNYCYLLTLLLISPALAQPSQASAGGTIHGVVLTPSGDPAKGLNLIVMQGGLKGGFSGGLRRARTNSRGEYGFLKLSWGAYFVFAEDEVAGYSRESTGPFDEPSGVEITPQQPDGEFNFTLPAKAGSIRIRASNQRTGAVIPLLEVWVSDFFTRGAASDRPFLVPPDRDLRIHVTANRFREWDESIETGRLVYVPSGTELILDVHLEPSD